MLGEEAVSGILKTTVLTLAPTSDREIRHDNNLAHAHRQLSEITTLRVDTRPTLGI